MGKQEVPKPLLIALVAVVLGAGAYFLLGNSSEEVPPPVPPPATPVTGATGATGATDTGTPTGATGETEQETVDERRQEQIDAANEAGLPLSVYLAKERGKVVVIFFYEPGGKVDERVEESVTLVKKRNKNMVVFREKAKNKSRYEGIAEAAKVTSTPALVIIYKDNAALVEGYIDAAALNERVAQIKD